MTRVAPPLCLSTASSVPTSRTRSPWTATACTTRNLSSTVTTLPLWRIRSAGSAARATETRRQQDNETTRQQTQLSLAPAPEGRVWPAAWGDMVFSPAGVDARGDAGQDKLMAARGQTVSPAGALKHRGFEPRRGVAALAPPGSLAKPRSPGALLQS